VSEWLTLLNKVAAAKPFHREGNASVIVIGNICGIAALSTGVVCCPGDDSSFDRPIKKSRMGTEHASLTPRVYSV
jgi:hypothetical protein